MRRRRPEGSRAPLVLAATAVLVTAADTYVVVIALPDMMAGVGLSLDQLQRGAPLVSAFLLGYVAVLALAGRVSDAAGRVPVLVTCLVLFALGSLVTAGAHSLAVAVTGRGLQGLGAGGLVPPTLALVADLWPADRRGVPLGAVGAAQELGSVLGPLYGAAVLAVSGWRAIFWVNLVLAGLLAVGLAPALPRGGGGGGGRRRVAVVATAGVLGAVALALVLDPPGRLSSSVSLGGLTVPLLPPDAAFVAWTSPLALAAVALGLLAVGVAVPAGVRALRGSGVDVLGAGLLALTLAAVVLTFAGAETTRSAVDRRWPWYAALGAAAAAGFAARHRWAARPLVPRRALARRGAWGALVVNLLVGAALVAALVDVPVFARLMRYPDEQLPAALVLVQLLAAVPVGALAGGWATHRLPPRGVAAAGLATAAAGLAAMATWDADAVPSAAASGALVATGLGFGLAIAPVNAVLLASTEAAVHGLASALGVLARMVGMLVGLSALSAVGLRVFYRRQAGIGSPATLCPSSPADCPAFVEATRASALAELHTVFAGAALCAAVAAVLALLLVDTVTGDARTGPPGPGGTRRFAGTRPKRTGAVRDRSRDAATDLDGNAQLLDQRQWHRTRQLRPPRVGPPGWRASGRWVPRA